MTAATEIVTDAPYGAADTRARALSEREYTAVAVVAALVAILGLLGFVNSFAGVQAAAEPSFGWLSFTVPLGIDLGIAVFSALDIVLARLDMRLRWLRLIPWALTGVTVYLNVAGQHGLFGQVAHAVLPCLWVLAVEVAAHVIRVRAQLVADTRMDTIRRSRWFLAPWPTWKLWRRMVLWEIRSYPDALARERDRLLALTDLQDRYGRIAWRWKAPRRERALYRLGELAPAAGLPALPAPAPAESPTPVEDPAPTDAARSKPRKTRTTTSRRTARRTKRAPAPDVEDLMPLGWRIAADLEAAGRPLTRDALRDALKEAGASASNTRAGALLARLRTEAPADPAETPDTTTDDAEMPAVELAAVDGGDRPVMTEHTQSEEPMGDVIPFTGRTTDGTDSTAPDGPPAVEADDSAPRPAAVPDHTPDRTADESGPAGADGLQDGPGGGPVVEGEIVRVDRPEAGPRDWLSDLETRARERRPIVPPWARSRTELRATVAWVGAHYAHVAGYHAARTPLYAARVSARAPRGLFRVVGGFLRWTFDWEGEPVRLAAVQKADPEAYLKLSRQRDSRVRLRVAVALGTVALTVAALIVVLAAPSVVHWAVFAAVVAALGVAGAPADRPLIDRAVVAAEVEKLTSDIVVRALGSLNIAAINQAIAKGRDGIQFLAPITRDGPGYRADVNLPHGVTVNDVIERRDRLASGLRRPLGCVWPEAVPGEHTGRLLLWVGDKDMAKTKQPAWPLRRTGTVDLFKAAPFGTDQRGRWVPLTLMYVSVIIGAIPRMGKTFLLRLLLLIAAMDPRAEIHAYALSDLRDLRNELRRRAKVIRELPKDICPESKVTPELATKKSLSLHPIVFAVDECQVWFEHPKHGDEFEAICTDLVKRGPALGMVPIFATQRPDSKALPTGISANASVRLCLKVMGQMENDMVLGTSQYKNGVRATMFSFNDKGICYFVGDGDEPRIVRSVYIDAPEAEKIALHARAVRERQGRLSGYALGADSDGDTGPAYDVLADVLAVTSADEGRVWNETVVERLAELRPDVYGAWKPEQLTVALKPYGAETVQVAKRVDGRTINRRGIDPTWIAELVTERN